MNVNQASIFSIFIGKVFIVSKYTPCLQSLNTDNFGDCHFYCLFNT